MGAPKFENTVRIQAAAQNVAIQMDLMEATRVVGLYRRTYPMIPKLWKVFDNYLGGMATGSAHGAKVGPVTIEKNAILLPSGLRLFYHNLRHNGQGWTFEYGGKPKHTYGAKITENVVQALARIAIMEAAVRIRARLGKYGIELAHQVHDELIYVVPTQVVGVVKKILEEEMARRPKWMPDLPLASETGSGANYGDAK